ncbi:MAG TPA: CHAT domain-containing protein, partial [Thermoanaerobaculia bacterium]|nr:CHAT domain-containing protein [Thermoanaerobaculia bacterium]
VWTLSSDSFNFHELPIGAAAIERWSTDLQTAADRRDTDAFERGVIAPYRLLATSLRDLARSGPLESVVIVPDGAMTGLPFGALRDPETRRYLIEDVSIATAASATQYIRYFLRDRASPTAVHPQVLLMADPSIDQSLEVARGLVGLPGARDEVQRISQSYEYRAKPIIRVGQASTVRAFLDMGPKSVVMHIAAHSINNTRLPSQSLLLLSPSASDSGILTYENVLEKVDLTSTKLVVLSFCSTGFPSTGSDTSLLPATAFLGAGAAAVVGSLWSVNDRQTVDFMAAFHRRYAQGDDVASALRQTQLEQLRSRNPARRSPLAWGQWQVLGVGSSRLNLSSVNSDGEATPER